MNEMTIRSENIPVSVVDLSRFVLIGRDRLVAVRAAIRAIDRVGVAAEVRRQKLEEAQGLAEAVLDAETRLGELRQSVRREAGERTDRPVRNSASRLTPLQAFDEKAHLQKDDARRFEALASHRDVVERVKAKARENGDIVTRQVVLNAINADLQAECAVWGGNG